MCQCLRTAGDPAIREWYEQYKDESNRRQFRRIYDKYKNRLVGKPPVRTTIYYQLGDPDPTAIEAEKALIKLGGVYQRLGKIVDVGEEKGKTCDGEPVTFQVIKERTNHALMRDLSRATKFKKCDKRNKRWVSINPPMEIIHKLKEEGRSNLDVLRGFISAPTLRNDGSILQKPGYDEKTGLFYDPQGVEFPLVPKYPTKEEGRAALDDIIHLLRGFPFDGKLEEANPSRSVTLAAILTAPIRLALLIAPGFVFDAPVPALVNPNWLI
jgi:putative DNA primase/helicase